MNAQIPFEKNSRMTHLDCPFSDKDLAKSLGARWDSNKSKWYVPDGVSLDPFSKWLPDYIPESTAVIDTVIETEDGSVSLSSFLKTASSILKKHIPDSAWIRAEVSNFQRNGKGFVAFELVEYSEAGVLLAKTRAFIWANDADRLLKKFSTVTDTLPSPGIKILVKVHVDIHSTGGLSVVICDIDPSYTLGDIEANLKRIRETLTKEGVILKNKTLRAPDDFCRVIVISPDGAAGLGDFKRDADILEKHDLCSFKYITATFQGHQAISSLVSAFKVADGNDLYDAVCLIRGGGSTSDLYWLNHIELARSICSLSIPVFTGIGHEKDNTIADEIAHTRFDTPSKVIGHIRTTIVQNAINAEANFKETCSATERLTSLAELRINTELNAIKNSALTTYMQAEQAVNKEWLLLTHAADRQLHYADQQAGSLFNEVQKLSTIHLTKMDSQLDSKLNEFMSHADEAIKLADRNIDLFYERLAESSLHHVKTLSNSLDQLLMNVRHSAMNQLDVAMKDVTQLSREILGLGPQSVLKRGFAVVRNANGKPVSTVSEAKKMDALTVEFKDGSVTVRCQI